MLDNISKLKKTRFFHLKRFQLIDRRYNETVM